MGIRFTESLLFVVLGHVLISKRYLGNPEDRIVQIERCRDINPFSRIAVHSQ